MAESENSDRPQFARFSNGEEVKDLRQDCPTWILNVLDAVSIARGDSARTALVNEVLGEWAKKKLHEASLVQRLSHGNPQLAEGARQ